VITTAGPDVLTRALALSGYYQAVAGDAEAAGAGWIGYRQLTSPAGLRELADRAAEWYGVTTTSQRAVAVGLAVGSVASMLASALTGALCLDEGALRLDPDALAFRFGADGLEALGVPEHGVELVADRASRERVTATGYATLLAPLLDGAADLARRRPRALGIDAGDRLVTALFRNCHALGLADAQERAEALLTEAPARLRHGIRLMHVPCGGATVTWKCRAVCCLAYQTPRSSGEYCVTCPRLRAEERACRVAAWLAGISD
jgi:hypothetical protein